MNTALSYEVRALLCSNCGAPLAATTAGGAITCHYCQVVNLVSVRDERPLLELAPPGAVAPLNEEERLARLRAQEDRASGTPKSVEQLLDKGKLPAWKLQEAFAVWQSTRKELSTSTNYDAAELLLHLSIELSQAYARQNDVVRQRALLESALDGFTLARHRQVMRSYLSRAASGVGDEQAAEHWLALCDAHSDDLEMDSHFRLARAFLDTARLNYSAVLRTLGRGNADVMILAGFRVLAGVLRANAIEKLGDVTAAAGVLHEAEHVGEVKTTGRTQVTIDALRKICLPESKAAIDEFIAENPALKLCAQARAQATALQQADTRAELEQQAANLALAVGGTADQSQPPPRWLVIALTLIILAIIVFGVGYAVVFGPSSRRY
ncbi:MAG TPA: hypothetical protein VNG33_05435 [Polyangiaceae bacterium]|nr:hypothetical protein [Polyangiaceae bacterium]